MWAPPILPDNFSPFYQSVFRSIQKERGWEFFFSKQHFHLGNWKVVQASTVSILHICPSLLHNALRTTIVDCFSHQMVVLIVREHKAWGRKTKVLILGLILNLITETYYSSANSPLQIMPGDFSADSTGHVH